jgi:hypothetical protein
VWTLEEHERKLAEKLLAAAGSPEAAIELTALMAVKQLGYCPLEVQVAVGLVRAGIGGKNKDAHKIMAAMAARIGITRDELLEAFDGGRAWLDAFAMREQQEHKATQTTQKQIEAAGPAVGGVH